MAGYTLWLWVLSSSPSEMMLFLIARHSIKRSESLRYFCELQSPLFSSWGQREGIMRHGRLQRDQLALRFLERQCTTHLGETGRENARGIQDSSSNRWLKVREESDLVNNFSKWWSCFGLPSPHWNWRRAIDRSSIHFVIGSWVSLSRAWGLSAQDC